MAQEAAHPQHHMLRVGHHPEALDLVQAVPRGAAQPVSGQTTKPNDAGISTSAPEPSPAGVISPPAWARSPGRDGFDTLLIGPAGDCLAAVDSAAFSKDTEFRPIGFVDVENPPGPGAYGYVDDIDLLLGVSGAQKVVVCGDLTDVQFQSVVEATVAAGCQVLSLPRSPELSGANPTALWRQGQPHLQLLDKTELTSEPLTGGRTALRIDVYADGADLKEMLQTYRVGVVRGFTTNPTLMRKAGVSDYAAFAQSVLAEIRDLPISFEVFADELPEMERQALAISSWGQNVFVKIPVTNTKGESSIPLVRQLVAAGVKLNVTALMTEHQVAAVAEVLSAGLPTIVSVFAGRIADTGRDPMPIMRRAARLISRNPSARLLWASPREVLNIYQAEACGCHIVTVTKALLDKLPMRGMDLDELSCHTVKMFHSDAQAAGYSIR